MSIGRLWAMIKKENTHVLRDPRSLLVAILIPLIFMVAYCESLSLDINNIPMVVIDYDRTNESRNFIGRFTNSGYFSVIAYLDNYRQMQDYVDRGKAVMGLSIPTGFSKKVILSDESAPVQVLLDGTDPSRGSAANGYSMMICQKYSQELRSSKIQMLGLSSVKLPVDPRVRVWFNPLLEAKTFWSPG